MVFSDKTNLLVRKYIPRKYPELEKGLLRYISDEVQNIKQSTTSLSNAAIQVSDDAPSGPYQRYGALRSVTVGPTWQRFQRPCRLQRQRLGPSLNSQEKHNAFADGRKSEASSLAPPNFRLHWA